MFSFDSCSPPLDRLCLTGAVPGREDRFHPVLSESFAETSAFLVLGGVSPVPKKS